MDTDKQRIGTSFARHFRQYESQATVQRHLAEKLDAALASALPELSVERALEIGIGTGFLTRLLTARYPHADWWFNDLTPAAFDWIPAGLRQAIPLPGDAETLDFPPALQLLASASSLQWFRDLPEFLVKARHVLHPGGALAIGTYGSRNFHQLRQLLGTGLDCPTLAQLKQWTAQAGFHIHVASEWEETLTFPSARELLHHLHSTGVNAIPCGQSVLAPTTPKRLLAFEQRYRAAFPQQDAHLPLTYHPLILIAQRPSTDEQA